MRIIGLDIHRAFAQAVGLDDGECIGRVGMTQDQLGAFAARLRPTDHIVVEATGNATAVLEILAPHVGRVAVANPLQVHLIAKAQNLHSKFTAIHFLSGAAAASWATSPRKGRRYGGVIKGSEGCHATPSPREAVIAPGDEAVSCGLDGARPSERAFDGAIGAFGRSRLVG